MEKRELIGKIMILYAVMGQTVKYEELDYMDYYSLVLIYDMLTIE